jgi:hypothetical protein
MKLISAGELNDVAAAVDRFLNGQPGKNKPDRHFVLFVFSTNPDLPQTDVRHVCNIEESSMWLALEEMVLQRKGQALPPTGKLAS